jgi:hypothetical protein
MAETIGSFAALGDSFTEGLNDPRPGGGFVGWADRTAGAREFALPWASRRLRRISSGDGLPPKRPELLPVR